MVRSLVMNDCEMLTYGYTGKGEKTSPMFTYTNSDNDKLPTQIQTQVQKANQNIQ